MSGRLFRPPLRHAVWLAALALISIGLAAYIRYRLVEQTSVGLACTGGAATWWCGLRSAAIALFTPQAFGGVAVAAAVLHLLRPGLALCAVAVVSAGLGIMLYNVALSALAVAILILSLARPAAAAK